MVMKSDFIVWRTAREREFLHEGKSVFPPPAWVFVPAGDPGLTRKLKSAGECWIVVHKRKNRVESLGLWTDGKAAAEAKRELEERRASPEYAKKQESARRSRAKKEERYGEEFRIAVLTYLRFAPCHAALAEKLASLVTRQTIPVGAGTVARTQRLPIGQRAEAAVIAWMRHNTTAYDCMVIPRVKGERRAIRQMLASRSRQLLERYREGKEIMENCPLAAALAKAPSAQPNLSGASGRNA